jgi:hypothetical protein
VVAEGEHHLKLKGKSPMHDQLNQLASSLAPTYTAQGYMAGNIHKLTVGNYITNQYGIINGLTYEIMDESPWDIEKGKQLPMYIKVTGFQFTPIHNFRPEYKINSSPKFISQANQTIALNTPTQSSKNTASNTQDNFKPVFGLNPKSPF